MRTSDTVMQDVRIVTVQAERERIRYAVVGGCQVYGLEEVPAFSSSLNKTIAGCDSGLGVSAVKLCDDG